MVGWTVWVRVERSLLRESSPGSLAISDMAAHLRATPTVLAIRQNVYLKYSNATERTSSQSFVFRWMVEYKMWMRSIVGRAYRANDVTSNSLLSMGSRLSSMY